MLCILITNLECLFGLRFNDFSSWTIDDFPEDPIYDKLRDKIRVGKYLSVTVLYQKFVLITCNIKLFSNCICIA